MKQHLIRTLPWLLVLAIVVLSVVPPGLRPVVAARDIEHLTIFLALGFTFGLAYPGRCRRQVIVLLVFTALVELGQFWIPGRHARLEDFAVGALGCLLGVGLVLMTTRLFSDRIGQ